MDQPLPLPNSTAFDQSWNFETRLEGPTSLSWSSSDTGSSHSDVDSAESHSTYQDSPLTETPLETPLSSTEGFFPHVTVSDSPVVAVLGVGYVGLHLVTAFSSKCKVIAFDVSEKRLETVAGQLSDTSNIFLTSDPSRLATATHFLVAVPTPLVPYTTKIDTSIIRNALNTLCDHIRPGATVVIESSVSVGMTRSLLSKIVQSHNVYAGMSPEVKPPNPPRALITNTLSAC